MKFDEDCLHHKIVSFNVDIDNQIVRIQLSGGNQYKAIVGTCYVSEDDELVDNGDSTVKPRISPTSPATSAVTPAHYVPLFNLD